MCGSDREVMDKARWKGVEMNSNHKGDVDERERDSANDQR